MENPLRMSAGVATNKQSDSTASLLLAERWTITEICQQLNSMHSYFLLTDILLLTLKKD